LHFFRIWCRLGLVLEKAHGILDKDFVLKADEFDDFFSDPRANDLQIYFAHVYFCVELRGKLD